jgi:S-DNA-T family DNA segregation ATPase FtsK/SpoIIIE
MYKTRLKNAFVVAGLYLDFKKGDTPIRRFPSIGAFHNKKDYLEYVFYLPQGMNPAKIEDSKYIFSQTFGKSFELKGDGLKYVLKVFKKELAEKIAFDLEEIEQRMSDKKMIVPIVAGYDALGELIMYDMAPDPNLLIAGETGSGKSVMLKAILVSLMLFRRGEIEYYLADLKMAQFHLYRRCEDVKTVDIEPKAVLKTLQGLEKELTVRCEIFDKYEVEDITEYNQLKGVEKKKPILFCVDEVVVLKGNTKAMQIIERIVSLGRACLMFVIFSVQRPDAKIFDGAIKANLTVRYAFRHADKTNSNITLGSDSGVDASKIKKSQKGKFYMRHDETVLLKAPMIEKEEAKELLKPLKRIPIPDDIPKDPNRTEPFDDDITDFNSKEDDEK